MPLSHPPSLPPVAQVVLLLNVVFIFATATATATVVLTPAVSALMPPALASAPVRLPLCGVPADLPLGSGEWDLPLASLVGTCASFGISLCWFALRTAPWAWLLQDGLSVTVCLLFVRTIRVPSLRIAALFLGLMFAYDIFMVFVSPLLFHKSVMLEVATAGAPTETIGAAGKCVRTAGEAMPMLMAIPRLSPLPAVLPPYAPLAASSAAPPSDALYGMDPGFAWRLSGASGDYGMIGLGDIVLPALALAYARRIDLASEQADAPGGGGRAPCCGYFAWAVCGYALGLLVTLAANAYGWTFNGVQGQPALLYLVPGVIGSQLMRALLVGELSALWNGTPLPQPPEDASPLVCDGCGSRLLLTESVWSDAGANLDYCAECVGSQPEARRSALTELPVWRRCGVDAPAAEEVEGTYPSRRPEAGQKGELL